tara:strand:+ start:11837 stop:13585 length:1749 start_codon:yes stop_codon:yes gene_type:complete
MASLTMRRRAPESLAGVLLCLVLVALIVLPMVMVLLHAFFPGLLHGDLRFTGPGHLLELFNRRLWRVSLSNSLTLASGTAVLGTLLGVGLAMMRHSTAFAGARALDTAAWVLLIMPSFVLAQGWVLFAMGDGIAARWLGIGAVGGWVFSPGGLILIMSLSKYPFAYLAVSAAMQWQVREYRHAAELCGAGPLRTLLTVRFPLLLPAILSGMVLVFIDTIGDFGLPAALATTYRFPTLPYTIYAAINQSPIRFDLAGVLSIYLMTILMVAVALYLWLLRRIRAGELTARAQPGQAGTGRHDRWCSLLTTAFLALALGVPLGSSFLLSLVDQGSAGPVWNNFTLAHYAEVLGAGSPLRESLANSLWIAACAAAGSLAVSLLATYLLCFSRFALNGAIDAICTASLAVPGVILGVGYIFVWNHPWLDRLGLSLYGHPSILVLAAMAGAIPIAIRVLMGSMSQVPASFLHAAALQGASLPRRVFTIVVPLTLAALLTAVLTAFGTSVFDLATTAILHPPGYPVLPVTIDRLFHQGRYGLSTAATLVAGSVTVTVILLVKLAAQHFFRSLFARSGPARATPRETVHA